VPALVIVHAPGHARVIASARPDLTLERRAFWLECRSKGVNAPAKYAVSCHAATANGAAVLSPGTPRAADDIELIDQGVSQLHERLGQAQFLGHNLF
jgi:hypothetical protein